MAPNFEKIMQSLAAKWPLEAAEAKKLLLSLTYASTETGFYNATQDFISSSNERFVNTIVFDNWLELDVYNSAVSYLLFHKKTREDVKFWHFLFQFFKYIEIPLEI